MIKIALDQTELDAALANQKQVNQSILDALNVINKKVDELSKVDIEIIQRIVKLETGVTPTPEEIKWPYDNWDNSKYTFPDASEVPSLSIRRVDYVSPFIKFNPDGSIRYTLPKDATGTPTPNATNLRMERRQYKDMAKKTNFVKGDIRNRDMFVEFHELRVGLADTTFDQMHGTPLVVNGIKSDTPYWKLVAGKLGVRIQAKTKFALKDDDFVKTLVKPEDLKYGVKYPNKWSFDGNRLNLNFAGTILEVLFDRPDHFYDKEGNYGPLGTSLTHHPKK